MVGIRWKDWNTMPTWSRRKAASWSSFRPLSDVPATVTSPFEAFSSPAITISSVVLPEPEGPTMPSASPGFTSRSTPRRMSTLPARLGSVRWTFRSETELVVMASNMAFLTRQVEKRMLEPDNRGA